MTDEVYECFRAIIQNRPTPEKEPMIAGKTGFVYLDKRDAYGCTVCRHTYCSNCARAGMNRIKS